MMKLLHISQCSSNFLVKNQMNYFWPALNRSGPRHNWYSVEVERGIYSYFMSFSSSFL